MIIMVLGLPGSGKSYFAEKLAICLRAVYINSDRVRNSMHANGKYSYKDKLLVYAEMVQRASTAIKDANYVVVDATFFKTELRELFFKLADDCDVQIRLIEIVADEALEKERLEKKRTVSEANYSVYLQLKENFDQVIMPHLVLKSSNDNIESMLITALKYILDEGD